MLGHLRDFPHYAILKFLGIWIIIREWETVVLRQGIRNQDLLE